MNRNILARVVLLLGYLLLVGCGQESFPKSSTASAKNVDPPSEQGGSATTGPARDSTPKTTPHQSDSQLTLHVQLDEPGNNGIVDIDNAFRITLKNTADHPIRFWNPDTRNGYYQLVFRLKNLRTGVTYTVRHTQIDDDEFWESYEEDIEPGQETIEIAPEGEYTFYEGWGDLQNPYWVWSGLPDPNSADCFAISAEFTSSLAALNSGSPVWNGRIETDVVTATLVASRLKTPHDYLWHSFPDKALEMMKADRSWIGRQDENQWTPLHAAASYGHTQVVSWLLENGADVNAIACNGATPLHVTDDPDVLSVNRPCCPPPDGLQVPEARGK